MNVQVLPLPGDIKAGGPETSGFTNPDSGFSPSGGV